MKSIVQAAGLGLLMLAAATPAAAIPVISFMLSNSSVEEGSPVSVDVVASGLSDEFIGDYDLTIGWDASLLSLSAVTFDVFLDGPTDSISGFDQAPGFVNVFEVSLGALSNQAGLDGFRLFSLNFATLSNGLAILDFASGGILGNEFGESYEFGTSSSRFSITAVSQPPTSVPEPSSLGLMGVALAGVFLRRRRLGVNGAG